MKQSIFKKVKIIVLCKSGIFVRFLNLALSLSSCYLQLLSLSFSHSLIFICFFTLLPYVSLSYHLTQRCRKHFESGGVYFDIFHIFFCQFQKVGGVTKSRPINPFLDVVYLFLNVRFGQKVFNFTVFGCHDLRLACII